jgi:hypothetical protein
MLAVVEWGRGATIGIPVFNRSENEGKQRISVVTNLVMYLRETVSAECMFCLPTRHNFQGLFCSTAPNF